jgi:2-methylcitrate dehydratase PrpD
MDDVHRQAIVHPGDTVIPCCLALAEHSQLSSREFLDAVVRGYEVVIRLGLASGVGHYRTWYATSTCGVFGAAAAAAFLLRLPASGVVDALGHAGMMTGGLWQCRLEPTPSKQIATAHAALSGLLAAQFAAAGAKGPAHILEGPLGFFSAACPGSNPAAVTAEHPGWLIHEVSFKPWAACRHVHPAIEAALQLHDEGVDITSVQAVEIRAYRDAIAFADNPRPTTAHQARFSLQHCVAAALKDGDLSLSHAAPAALGDPALARLRDKTTLVEDAAMTAGYPARFAGAVSLLLSDGSRRSATVLSAKGDPENPMSPGAIRRKAEGLFAVAGHDAAAARRLASLALGLAKTTHPQDLGSGLRRSHPKPSLSAAPRQPFGSEPRPRYAL